MTSNITLLNAHGPFNQRVKTAWGFSALIDHQGSCLLFDTSGGDPKLFKNMQDLGIDVSKIQAVVRSYAHNGHTVGLVDLLHSGIQPEVYLHPAFPEDIQQKVADMTKVVITNPRMVIAEGIRTIGEMRGILPDQALLISTGRGR